MTCQELHCYLENPQRVEIYMYRESLPAAVLTHLSECRDCGHLFEEQKGLGISLNMVRDAAPQLPGALDAKVLANYRREMAETENGSRRGFRIFSNPWLLWGAVAAVMVVVAAVMFLIGGEGPITAKRVAPAETPKPAIAQQQRTEVPAKEAHAVEGGEESARRATGISKDPLPPGFASLMYCDELSCTGAMDVIRVELPPLAGQTSGPAASPVMAEVLVGADGVARGIRIVQ